MATLDVVTSPNDWPETYPQLRNLDTLLRCGICFEFMDTALILPQCSHNYCSLCIRRYIGYKAQCPACAKNVAQTDLKNNRMVDDVIKTYIELRSTLLKVVLSSQSTGGIHLTKKSTNHTSSPRGKMRHPSSQRATTVQPSSPLGAIHASSLRERELHPVTRPASYKSGAFLLDSQSTSNDLPVPFPRPSKEEAEVETDEDMFWSEDDDDRAIKDNGCTPMTIASGQRDAPAYAVVDRGDTMTLPSSSASFSAVHKSPVNRVDCPVCGVSISERHVNMHLDQCLRGGPKLTGATVTVSKAPLRKTLPKLVYSLMKDAELKKRVADFGVPALGNRQMLIRRHQDYTVIYNSECDSLNPMTPAEVAKAVVQNEKCKTQCQSTAPSSALKFVAKKGDDVETVSKAQRQYVKQHKSQFSELLAKTRRRLQEQRETPEYPTSLDHSSGGATECLQTEPVCCDSDTTLCSSPVVTADRVLSDTDDSERMVSDWELCDDRASPRRAATSSDDDELVGQMDYAIYDGSLCVKPFEGRDATSSDDDESAKDISDGSLCSSPCKDVTSSDDDRSEKDSDHVISDGSLCASLCKDLTSSDDDRPIKADSGDWALRSSPEITSSDDDQPLKTSAKAVLAAELIISRYRNDGDADSDATVDDGVGIGADEEQDREKSGDEMTSVQTNGIDDSTPRENDNQVAPQADNCSTRENHIQVEPRVDNGSPPKENHILVEPLDTDFEPIKPRRKRKKKASAAGSVNENGVVKKAKKEPETTAAQATPEPDTTAKKSTGRQLRARRRKTKILDL